MIEMSRKREAVKVVTALARFFRISLSRGKSLITVKDELEHVRNYPMIQQMRFGKFTYTIESDDEVLELASLKPMSQPAGGECDSPWHGIYDGDGEIFVRAWQEEKELYLEVRQRAGMTEEQVEASLTGYGARGVQARLRHRGTQCQRADKQATRNTVFRSSRSWMREPR